MKNPNSPFNKIKLKLQSRWSGEDYPGAKPRFQFPLFAKDAGVFVFLPIFSIVLFKSCENASLNTNTTKRVKKERSTYNQQAQSTSQIIDFSPSAKGKNNGLHIAKKAPGTVVKVRLLNQVETYSSAPVHAQIIDNGLGYKLRGGTLLGTASPDSTYSRINITFDNLKLPNRSDIAMKVTARALSLSGTLGVDATKKEGFFARAAFSGASSLSSSSGGGDNSTLKNLLLQALAGGLSKEGKAQADLEYNKSQVLVLPHGTEFLVELTDYFPRAN
ncbi:MAG: TrbI/VirB10 family protein [Bdellovibrionales bacterium]|nr:TrbI/VirB10 family protein [Bdellovibrionales bacterium]